MTTTTITPQQLPCTPTTQAVSAQDYVSITEPTTFLYYYNNSASSVALIVSAVVAVAGSYNCYAVVIPTDDECFIGPFDPTLYGSMISISTTTPSEVSVAAFWYDTTPPPSPAPVAIINGVENTQKIIILGSE